MFRNNIPGRKGRDRAAGGLGEPGGDNGHHGWRFEWSVFQMYCGLRRTKGSREIEGERDRRDRKDMEGKMCEGDSSVDESGVRERV